MNNTKIKRNKILITAVAMVLIIATLSLSLVGCSSKPKNVLKNDFNSEIIETQNVKLAMSSVATLSENGSVSKTITATVLPATAKNKAVDWSVSWEDTTNTQTVTNYVTVIPDADGSTSATVTCRQAFSGTIIVTVTTRESGYSATCIITFLGAPTNISLSGNVATSTGTITLGIGQDYIFDVNLSNPFNSVGSQFNNLTCSVNGVGSMVLGYYEYYVKTESFKWYDTSDETVTLNSLKNKFISANYANGKLTIKTIKSIESYYGGISTLDSGRTRAYSDKFRSYVDDCYFEVVITENVSGLSKTYKVRFDDSVVTGVDSNVTEIQF